MAIILQPEEMPTETSGDGWKRTVLADQRSIGTQALVAQRWSFEPTAAGPEQEHGDADQLLYVISGSGAVRVNGERLPLARETVLWLEVGDLYQFVAGEDGLEMLQGYAPGD